MSWPTLILGVSSTRVFIPQQMKHLNLFVDFESRKIDGRLHWEGGRKGLAKTEPWRIPGPKTVRPGEGVASRSALADLWRQNGHAPPGIKEPFPNVECSFYDGIVHL